MADNVYWSAIYLGNLAEMDTNEGSLTIEHTSPILKTFGAGAGNALANNIVNVETDTGLFDDFVTTDNDWLDGDTIHYNLGAGMVHTKLDAVMRLNTTVTFFDQTTLSVQVVVVQDQTGSTFALIMDSQPELASQGIDTMQFTSVVTSNYGSVTQYAANNHNFVCFTSSTLIDTPNGPVRMDRLRRGDLILTLDSGPQPITWIGKRRLRFHERPHPAQPILIRKGSFAEGRPKRDLMLSPNHRVLVETSPAYPLHDPLGALVPIKALTRINGIRPLTGRREITYFSLLLPQHDVVIANGIAVESLYPGREVFGQLTGAERTDWLKLAARHARVTGVPPARLMLSVSETRAALQDKLLTLPATAPRPLTWSLARHQKHALPTHMSRRS